MKNIQIKKKESVGAVIVAFNDYASVLRLIESLQSQVSFICVVDNSTFDDKFICDSKDSAEIIYIKNKTNLGLGEALNIGIKKVLTLKTEWVLLLDQDSMVDFGMIENMLSSYYSANDKLVAQIVPLVYDNNTLRYLPSLIFRRFGLKKIYAPKEDTFIDFQITSGSLIKKEIFEKIGFMDEKFFIDYIDFDYCFRLRSFKYKILLSKNALLHHSLGEKSFKMGICFIQHPNIRIFYQVRNRLIVMKRYSSVFPYFTANEIKNLILKLGKIIILEDDKKKKFQNYFKGFYAGLLKKSA
jgi:rhamnosyltransferase